MKSDEIKGLIKEQQLFFDSGVTLPLSFRKDALKKLYSLIEENEALLQEALKADLGKSAFEADMCEIRLTLSEISYMLKNLKHFAKKKRVHTPLSQAISSSYTLPSPYGNVLIMSPWNYPILLTLDPLVDAIAAGNTAIIKPSAYSMNVSSLLNKLISSVFNKEYIAVVEGGREENQTLLDEHFDYIFFTGSKSVGRFVMSKATEHLTPVTLELGGKSPVIVCEDADISLSARRIVFGKFLNLGQTCVAPDFLLVPRTIHDKFLEALKIEIVKQYSSTPLTNPDYGKIISKKHFDRISLLIDRKKVVFGGNSNPKTLQIEPTILDNVTLSDAVMKDEIFGPVMPIIIYDTLQDAIQIIKSFDHPLAFYVFTKSKKRADKLINSIGFGGGCINDTIIHLATSQMGFGGFGESGMGSYHGKSGFDTFSHNKSIVDKKRIIDLPMRYAPYKKFYHQLIKLFLK